MLPIQDSLDVLQHVRDGMSLFWTAREHRNEQIPPCPKQNALEVGNTNDMKRLDDFAGLMTPDFRSKSKIHKSTVTSSIPIQR
jgi:hypothetical protein